ncbi:MAG: tRNA preQ1(34) S-adenosylmethionine ribosyltransferase-isomerase QueA [candidate division Zixibacteria bacterium]|nr:tRNA preQ1(34) S-adenosylmethionine ribosyltransferase-isomerase QueA [candidate division Zixibacteria bacterium]
MKVTDLDYYLPKAQIASEPTHIRRNCRLLRLDRRSGDISQHIFADLPKLLNRGDLIVANDTQVIPARLLGHRAPGGGEAEIFLLEQVGRLTWRAMVRPGRRLKPGATVEFGANPGFRAEIVSSEDDGTRLVRFTGSGSFDNWLESVGHVPLPPYIERPDQKSDRRDYQTMFARHAGAVAAPTAGLHFDQPLLKRLNDAGIVLNTVTVHVGAGTFRPIRSEHVEDHELEAERYRVGVRVQQQIRSRKQSGESRVIAVGTTVTRALETLGQQRALDSEPIKLREGRTSLLISPGHEFRLIDGLITNFHLPKSSLLALVAAFAGLEPVMQAYEVAVKEEYRFYSYGDAMLII